MKKREDMGQIAGRNLEGLCEAAGALVDEIRRRARSGRGKDQVCTAITDLWQVAEEMGRRVGSMEFAERPAAAEEEEKVALEPSVPPVSFAALIDGDEDDGPDEYELRVAHFQKFLDYLCAGSRCVEDVTRNVLAVTRRVRPEVLRGLGLSQADVSRRLGETRAATQAREKRMVEEPVKATGEAGFRMLGGTRSEETRRRCRRAQKGNQNRNGGRKRGAKGG